VIQYSGANLLRLWLHNEYVDNHALEDAINAGIEQVIGTYFADPVAEANAIQRIVAAGFPVHFAVLQNEPDHNQLSTPDHTRLFRDLRSELDSRGLQQTKLMCCDDANVDDYAKQRIDAISSDPAAAPLLAAFSTHSYTMAAEQDYARRVFDKGLSWWQTEHSIDGPPATPDRYDYAALTSNVFLNDLNQGVTHWMYFQGYGRSTRPLPETHNNVFLAYWDDSSYGRSVGSGWFAEAPQLHYIRQINQAFPYGTTLRWTTATGLPSSDMVWTYGTRSPINAAVGRQPGGGFAVAVSNAGVQAPGDGVSYYQDYKLLIVIEELDDGATRAFRVTRSGASTGFLHDEGLIGVANGRFNLNVNKDELVTVVEVQ
jgi:hypothetical protein